MVGRRLDNTYTPTNLHLPSHYFRAIAEATLYAPSAIRSAVLHEYNRHTSDLPSTFTPQALPARRSKYEQKRDDITFAIALASHNSIYNLQEIPPPTGMFLISFLDGEASMHIPVSSLLHCLSSTSEVVHSRTHPRPSRYLESPASVLRISRKLGCRYRLRCGEVKTGC